MITGSASAQSANEVEVLHQTTLNLIKLLVKSGVLTQDAADQLLRDAEQAAAKSVAASEAAAGVNQAAAPVAEAAVPVAQAGAPAVKPGVVRVTYVPEVVRREIKEEIRQEVLAQAKGERWGDPGALPDWLGRISWDGDLRLRYQRDGYPANNAPPSAFNPVNNTSVLQLVTNTTDTRQRLRLQARLGMKAKVSDNTFAAFRLTTGTTTDPVSTNQTLGSSGNFNKSSVVFDRAYIQSSPYRWLTLSGGKIPNPWLSTDLVWDTDVNFEGVAASFTPRFNDQWNGVFTAGAFPVQEIERSTSVFAHSKWLYGAQAGAEWTGLNSSNAKFGVALYQFKNVEGIQNPTLGSHIYDKTAFVGVQKGNTLMDVNVGTDPALWGIASRFKEVNLTGRMDWAAFDPIHVMLTADYVKNLGYDAADIARRGGIASTPRTVGYQSILAVGMPKIRQAREWQFSLAYKYLQSDAVLDALTDSDFHLGGTNAKGFILGGIYGLDKNTTLGLRWYSSNQIDGPQLAIDTLQLDLNARF
ncbi:MAG TPA: putative porin [Gallionella sp.]|nr:putative porin [Gallionella sp.]